MKEPVISVKDLSFTYLGSDYPALVNINMDIMEGQFILLTGPSGCGKTTLLRTFNGLIPNFYPGDLKGDARIYGLSIREHRTFELAKYVGMVFQDPENQLLTLSVERDIAFGLENLGLRREEIKERVDWALNVVGIERLREKAPHELSGGEQQKVAIAAAIAMQPKILVLDEPLSNLDPMSAKNIVELLEQLRQKLRLTIVVSEHRLDLLSKHADLIFIMKSGSIVASGPPKEILKSDIAWNAGISIPKVVEIWKILKSYINLDTIPPISAEEAFEKWRIYLKQYV
ncbi:MAG: energy-coupling factor ABC transporter ATP-binding protein [Thermoprotei archaeon]